MPRLSEAMKDVISCDKLRRGANNFWPVDFRMGQPNTLKMYCRKTLTRGTETSKYPEEEKTNSDFLSSGERTGKSPNQCCFGNIGVVGLCHGLINYRRTIWKVWPKRVIVPYLKWFIYLAVSWVGRDMWNPVWISRNHPVRLNTPERPIVNKYREGKVKSTPNRGVK